MGLLLVILGIVIWLLVSPIIGIILLVIGLIIFVAGLAGTHRFY